MLKMSPKKFVKLQKKWYEKLAESGFNDIEEQIGTNWHLKTTAADHCKTTDPVVLEAKRIYYQALGEHVDKEVFECFKDEYVMRRLALGAKNREISEELIEKLGLYCHRQSLCFIRRRYEHKWGIKQHRPEDLQPPIRVYKPKIVPTEVFEIEVPIEHLEIIVEEIPKPAKKRKKGGKKRGRK